MAKLQMNELKSALKKGAQKLGVWPVVRKALDLKEMAVVSVLTQYLRARGIPPDQMPTFVSEALYILHPRTPVGSPRSISTAIILSTLVQNLKGIEGDIVECGVQTGRSLIPMGIMSKLDNPQRKVYGLDSWDGFPPPTEHDIQSAFHQKIYTHYSNAFKRDQRNLIQLKLSRLGLDNVTLIKGFFEDSLPQLKDRKFALVHIDCDSYSGYKTVMEFCYPRLVKGGFMVFDDYAPVPKDSDYWPGAYKAVTEFFAGKPEKVIQFNDSPLARGQKTSVPRCYIQKLS